MGSDAVVVVGELPVLPPIKTSLIGREKPPAAATAEGSSTKPVQVATADDEECVTPKAEEHVLKPAAVCPPAPRKARPAKRALHEQAPAKGFHVVPRDLSSVFLTLPPKKRIRVG